MITLINGNQEGFYIELSLQEKKKPSKKIINDAKNYENVLLALREKA